MPLDSSANQEHAILIKARALAPGERAAFLQEACGMDSELRRRIEAGLKAERLLLAQEDGQAKIAPGGTIVVGESSRDRPSRQSGAPGLVAHSETGLHGRFLPGARIAGRYRIVFRAGQGGMGEVYRADDLKLNHPVALKFLPPGLNENSPLFQYLVNEVRLSRQIAHPNVCRVYDLAEVEGQHFLSMEYIDGEDLRSLLRRIGRLPPDKGIQIAQQLCAGLAAAHNKGVLHRDLKPANIMIDGGGQARITDFGLARLADENGSGEIAGTPAYMAPEQSTRGETTIQSDLYSLGLVLFEMFTGQPAYQAGSIPQQPPELAFRSAPELDPGVERIIAQCLQQDPQHRPKSARAVAAALPGGDPLAAALAVGETPSPEMVAAAGGEGVIGTRTGLVCLGGLAIGLVLACWLANSTYRVNRAGADKHPQAMAADARRIIEQLGYSTKSADSAFEYANEGTASLHFWYRQRPQYLGVNDFFTGYNQLSYGRVTEDYPAWGAPGELGVRLNPRGELLDFRAVPPSVPLRSVPEREPEWTNWFPKELLGFDLGHLENTTDKVLRPHDPYDHLRVWRARGPTTNEFYVVAAACDGRPTYFVAWEPSRFETSSTSSPLDVQRIGSWMYLALVASASVLAWRDVRLRRSDRRGAFRVAFYFFVIGLLITAIQAQHTIGTSEAGVFELGLAQAASRAIIFWLWYTALEPYVRRLWPHWLISWTRLLEGRWRDPLVGRDLLIGSLFGLALNLTQQLSLLAAGWLGPGMQHFQSSPTWTLAGPGSLSADVFLKQLEAVFLALFYLMSLLLLRFVSRRMVVVSVVFIALFTTLRVARGMPVSLSDWLASALWMGISLWALIQWGFLASVISLLCYSLLTFPLTTNLSAWYASHGLAGIGTVIAIACLGFYTSKGTHWLWSGQMAART
jgi:serine/threonine-protein kinase